YKIFGIRFSASGGFYLRLYPRLVSMALRSINKMGYPGVIYLHNWEFDENCPRLNLPPVESIITYYNIENVRKSLEDLLKEFRFISIKQHLEKSANNF
ncbi:DUF3473 domain-containing protein, partial [Candidatus Bathyarchaeota archaeon]|nr:DUF3473 domain-containing protein [Candidatus Bathyarchaeota archaeon]